MSIGNGGQTLQTLPATQFQMDPVRFATGTKKRKFRHSSFAKPGAGAETTIEMPQTGVLTEIRITFSGQVVVATAADTARNEWPYGLLSRCRLNINGQTELVNVEGEDLHALRYIRNPAFEDALDVYPGVVGGGTDLPIGTHPLFLTWVVPVAFDPVTLSGAIYAQSPSTNIELTVQEALAADLFETPANCTLTGTFSVEVTSFEVPMADGMLIVPDLTRNHAINSVRLPITNTGENRLELIRSSGMLSRLLISGESADNAFLSARPDAGTTNAIDNISFEYGSQERPFRYSPAANLLSENNENYGGLVPYERHVIDTVRHQPMRDAIYLQGLTEAAVVVDIGSGVTLTNGYIRLVQETLFQSGS